MPSYDKTSLWQLALATRVDDPYAKERERLRAAYELVRARAQPLAEEIARELPEYTVHDITHSDALWEYADLLVGVNYPISPCEAFVLGCAFLVHDLGMGLAAYPEGLAGLKKLAIWRDAVADLLRKGGAEEVGDQAIAEAPQDVQKQATKQALRQLHAKQAHELALIHWMGPGNQRFFLIEDAELRDSFGHVIGQISYSHWWPADQLAKELHTVMGAQVGFPADWTVDPLKLACILRCADYSHIDERRAPAFLRALRQPVGTSDDHWNFQSKLYQPRLEGDRLVFTAKSAFTVDDAGAWWVCFDTLSAIDSELRRVDSLLADTRRNRFAARGVSQAEEPSRLARVIRTDGWQPVDTKIRVTAVADLVKKLGGKDLYGNRATPPLRELIQNAADAIRARRLMDSRATNWGEIRVTTGKDETGLWIQIEDTGVGMAAAVLTGPFLDFGTSFWGSSLMHEQLPGLAAKGFEPIGRYGIGFFSVFMWGERVNVTTQRFDKGRDDTLVLVFRKGLDERPLLRRAQRNEHILDGGTRVKVWISDGIFEHLISDDHSDQKLTMAQVCGQIAPCLDVTLKVDGELAVGTNDWLTISDKALLKRILPTGLRGRKKKPAGDSATKDPPLKILRTDAGRAVGRAAIWSSQRFLWPGEGIVTVGGLFACRLGGIQGVLVGSPNKASRDSAVPVVPLPTLEKWVRGEAEQRLSERHAPGKLEWVAQIVKQLGVEPFGLPIAQTRSGWVTLEQIEELAKTMDEVLLVQDAAVGSAGGKVAAPQLNNGVFAVSMGSPTIVQSADWVMWPPIDTQDWRGEVDSRTLEASVITALARAWNCSVEEVLKNSSFGSEDKRLKRKVGTLAGNPYVEYVSIIRRPAKVRPPRAKKKPQRPKR